VSHAYCGGDLPRDVVVEAARLPKDRIGEFDPRSRRITIDVRRSPDPAETLMHEIAHVRTPQLALATWHGAPFERERLRLVGELWNGIKRREKRFSRGDHPGGRRPPGATSTAVHRKETLMLLPSHTHRREIADGDRPTGRETARRILAFERGLEARTPGATRWISGYRPFLDARGTWQPGAVLRDRPGALSVREARAIAQKRVERSTR